jgi:predicted CXXCH cytochrome family protein
LLNDFFWTDGMMRVSGREYNGLIESPCYKGRQFSCISCHSLHNSDPDDQLNRKATGNGGCLPCHQKFREEATLIAHTHHRSASSGSECYNCHMPHTTYGVLKAIRSHQISSPRVADDLTTGRPNACNLCHLDKSLAWTSERLAAWYGHPTSELPEESRHISHAVHKALSGDAGQRALAAWHLGWAPAMEASGQHWIPPILGQLLDDPYAAVRCIAERSLRTISGLTPDGYDYVVDPNSRPPARMSVLRNWTAQQHAERADRAWPAEVLATPDSESRLIQKLDEHMRQRNDRPMRLRE